MRARFIGDPEERSGAKPLTRPPSDEWFDVPEGMEERYRNNGHYEVEGAPMIGAEKATPRAGRRKPPPEPAKPKIKHDGWEDDDAATD